MYGQLQLRQHWPKSLLRYLHIYFKLLVWVPPMESVFCDTHLLGFSVGKSGLELNNENMRGTWLHLFVLTSVLANSRWDELACLGGSVAMRHLVDRKVEPPHEVHLWPGKMNVCRKSRVYTYFTKLCLSVSFFLYVMNATSEEGNLLNSTKSIHGNTCDASYQVNSCKFCRKCDKKYTLL